MLSQQVLAGMCRLASASLPLVTEENLEATQVAPLNTLETTGGAQSALGPTNPSLGSPTLIFIDRVSLTCHVLMLQVQDDIKVCGKKLDSELSLQISNCVQAIPTN